MAEELERSQPDGECERKEYSAGHPGFAGVGAGVGAASGALVGLLEDGLGAFMGGVTAILFWLLVTVLIWRETTAERVERLRARSPRALVCPRCGYNLTGLRQATCPECGAGYTIDELAALQPQREPADLQEDVA